jgi:hypothetical protein
MYLFIYIYLNTNITICITIGCYKLLGMCSNDDLCDLSRATSPYAIWTAQEILRAEQEEKRRILNIKQEFIHISNISCKNLS